MSSVLAPLLDGSLNCEARGHRHPYPLASRWSPTAAKKKRRVRHLCGDQNLFTYIPRQFQEFHHFTLDKLQTLSSTDILRLLVYVEPNVSHAIQLSPGL